MGDNTSNGDSWKTFRDRLKRAADTVRESPLGQGAGRYITGEWERILGNHHQHSLDANHAERLSMQLHRVLGNLIAACEDQKRQLEPGGTPIPWVKKEPPAATIDMAISGLVTITLHFQEEIATHVQQARAYGSKIAQSIPLEDLTASLPKWAMTRSVTQLPTEQAHNIAERLRTTHQGIINTAKQILVNVTGANGTNPYTQDAAMNESVRLLTRLWQECISIMDTLDAGYQQYLLRSGNSGKMPTPGRPRTDGAPPDGVEVIATPPKDVVEQG